VDYLRAAATNAGKPSSSGNGPERLVFDQSQPRGKLYRNAASEKLGTTARKMASDSRYRPDGEKTRAAEFVRDIGKELRATDVPELQGQIKDQYEQLKTSPFVEKLWVPERLPENERTKLKETRALLEQARDVANSLSKARKRADRKEIQKLARDLAEIQEKVQRKAYCLRLALKEAQTRGNNGDQVIAIWKDSHAAGGQGGIVAWVMPKRGTDSDLKPSDDWGKIPLPHIAVAAGKVSGYASLDAGFGSVETIEGLSLFVLKARKER
jgi:hypothetical protein